MYSKIVVHTHQGILFRDAPESVLMRWMNLEPTIQSEVSHKDKNKYLIPRICMESRKMILMKFTCRATMDAHREQFYGLRVGKEGQGATYGESNMFESVLMRWMKLDRAYYTE